MKVCPHVPKSCFCAARHIDGQGGHTTVEEMEELLLAFCSRLCTQNQWAHAHSNHSHTRADETESDHAHIVNKRLAAYSKKATLD